ncbi:MAG: restriction endonuclease, partial [Mesorhizobium sp.]|nr:restriction endonuclease [Mesorhizobium sp.]
ALDTLGGSASIEEIDDRTAQLMGVPEEVRTVLVGEGPRGKFDYRCAWARSWLKNAGLVDNSERGVWALTAEGRAALAMPPEDIVRLVRKADADLRKAKTVPSAERAEAEAEVAETADAVAKDWREQLLDVLATIEPSAFERLCQRILRESGFVRVEVTGKSGDGGIDGTGVLKMNLLSFHVLFQSKRYRGSVGSSVVRDFRGAMVGRADKGLIITTGNFTADARREATRDGAPAIDLIDGEALCDLLRDLGIGVKVKMVPEVTVDAAAFAAF